MPGFLSPQSLPPEFWDEVFKPRGPLGLFSGSTVLGAIPLVGQGMSAVDLEQSAREGSPLGIGTGILGMAPGGKTGGNIIDFLKELLKRPKRSPEREFKLGPKGAGKEDIISKESLEGYRAAIENWKAKNKLADLQGNDDITFKFSTDIKKRIEYIQSVQTSVETRIKNFLKPGKLTQGNAKELQSAFKVFQDQLNKGGIKIETLEEADAVIGALDDAGAITSTDQVIEMINTILSSE